MNLVESLTEREEAVTKEIVHGKTNREIRLSRLKAHPFNYWMGTN